MIFFTLSLAVLWSGCSCGGVNKFADAPPPYVTYSALQELDHFNYASSFIWKEKYLYSGLFTSLHASRDNPTLLAGVFSSWCGMQRPRNTHIIHTAHRQLYILLQCLLVLKKIM